MKIDRPPRECSFTPLFSVTLDPKTRYLTIPEFAQTLADAKFPSMADELSHDAALGHDVELRKSLDYQHFSSVAPNASNVALQRECARVSYMAEMQFAAREARMRILSRLTYRPVAVRFEQNPQWQQDVNAAIVPIDDLVTYAELCLVRVCFLQNGGTGDPSIANGGTEPTQRCKSRREAGKKATAEKYQTWRDDAQHMSEANPNLSTSDLARSLERKYRAENPRRKTPTASTIRNQLMAKS